MRVLFKISRCTICLSGYYPHRWTGSGVRVTASFQTFSRGGGLSPGEYIQAVVSCIHTQLYSTFERHHNYTQKNESENLTNEQHKTLKRYLVQSAQCRHIMFSEAENFCRNLHLHFVLLTETDGNGQLNISMQQLATSFDLVLKIFINAPTTI